VPVTFPRLSGEPDGATTPEELLAASHATCFGIGLRSIVAQRGGRADRIRVTATVTAEKGSGLVRIRSSHLRAEIEGLSGIDVKDLNEIGSTAEEACTISAAIRGNVLVTVEVAATSVERDAGGAQPTRDV
jgi:osmotically inducible protein OsmC